MSQQSLSRRRFLQLSAMGGVSLLAACGSTSTPPAPTTAPAASAATDAPAAPTTAAAAAPTTAPTTNSAALSGEITYMTYDVGPANASREEAVKVFQDQNPGTTIKLEVLPYGDMFTKLAAQMSTNQGPDVIYGDFSLLTYALGGQLLDLTELVRGDSTLTQANLFTTAIDDPIQAKYGTESIYALTMGTWVPILYYNRDLFDAAGVAYPTEDWTWEDLRTAAKTLTKPDAQEYGVQIGNRYDLLGWLWWSQQPENFWADPQVFPKRANFSNDTGLEYFRLIQNLAAVDKSLIPQAEADSYQMYGGGFAAGKVAMYSGGDWDAGWSFRELEFNWGMSFIPMMKAGYRPALNTMVSTNVINAGTRNQDLAWAFIRFLSATEEGQTLIGKGAYETPVLASVATSSAVLEPEWGAPGYDTRIRAAQLPGEMFTPYPLNLNLWEFNDKFYLPVMDRLEMGEITPEEAVAELDRDGTPYFAQQQRT